MGYTDYGIGLLGSGFVNGTISQPLYFEYGTGSGTFNGSTNYNNDGKLRKVVVWRFFKNNPQYSVQLITAEMIGSIIGEVGLGISSGVGSDLVLRDSSAIGTKTNAFSVNSWGQIRIKRLV